ncbi:MAG TPA: YdeI/OmpD-associated family protein [Actinomycetota bacterium]|nr:YdeI/OmpD-associated family protein [Actinomycetota bacterium]
MSTAGASGSHRFEAVVEVEGKAATYVEVPLDVRALFGRARPPVRATINGHTYRTTVAVYGGRYYLPLNRVNREAAGVGAGDVIEVGLAADDEARTLEVPDALAKALRVSREARVAFERLSYTHRREHIEYIAEAKRPETQRRRVDRTIERLRKTAADDEPKRGSRSADSG